MYVNSIRETIDCSKFVFFFRQAFESPGHEDFAAQWQEDRYERTIHV